MFPVYLKTFDFKKLEEGFPVRAQIKNWIHTILA